jgi:hypothetical protein
MGVRFKDGEVATSVKAPAVRAVKGSFRENLRYASDSFGVTPAFGASRPLPSVPAKIALPQQQPPFSLGGRNCSPHPEAAEPPNSAGWVILEAKGLTHRKPALGLADHQPRTGRHHRAAGIGFRRSGPVISTLPSSVNWLWRSFFSAMRSSRVRCR